MSRESTSPPSATGTMPWDGWGDAASRPTLPDAVDELLGGTTLPATPGTPLEDVRLRASALPGRTRAALLAVVGTDHLQDGRDARVRHAGGKSYTDLVRRRRGDAEDAPDAVLLPGSHAEVQQVLEVCAEHRVAVVPFGGGTSVVGGVEPLRGPFDSVVALDLGRLDAVHDVDPVSLTAAVGAGARGPAVEAVLARHGLTLGHFPQSFEHASIGGYLATRSAGQASTGYGRADDMVEQLRCATPSGDLLLGRGPASAAGPRLLDLLVGSEGVLGVITSATLALRRAPETVQNAGWSFPDLASGVDAFRALAQELGPGLAPDVCRLSDEAETATTLAMAAGSRKVRALRGYLGLLGRPGGCLAILGWEGTSRDVRHRRRAAARILRRHGGMPLGPGPGDAWRSGRYSAPYLRDTLLDHGLLVETLETATSWSDLTDLHVAVRETLTEALAGSGDARAPLVQCHVSHLYSTGASLYFTAVTRQDADDPVGQWQAAKEAATSVIASRGATVTHHHGIGRDHAPWMVSEVGEVGVRLLRAAKDALDPVGILNPGKLLPSPDTPPPPPQPAG